MRTHGVDRGWVYDHELISISHEQQVSFFQKRKENNRTMPSIIRQGQPQRANLLRLLIVLMGVVTTTLGSLRGDIMAAASLSSSQIDRALKGKNKKSTTS